jgi:uncharacterized membrane protein
VSVAAGRLLAASLGVLGIALAYKTVARLVAKEAAVYATALLALSVGYLFWCQSIRYYALLFVFQVAAVYFFVDGFETGRTRSLLLSCVFLLWGLEPPVRGASFSPSSSRTSGSPSYARERGGAYSTGDT